MKFDTNRMNKILTAKTDTILNNPTKYWKMDFEKGNRYLFVDNGAKILAVAHLDTVDDGGKYAKGKSNKPVFKRTGADDLEITSIALDDRLGVFLIMDVLPELGLNYDILLTTDEEIGMSTAKNFKTTKEYNWIFELDRRDYGTVVMYDYESKETKNAVSLIDYRVEQGSFSDICYLDDLGVAGFNFGVGYKYEHTNTCYTRTSWMNVVVNMFVDFFEVFEDTKFEYEKKSYKTYYRYDDDDYNWGSYYNQNYKATGTKNTGSGTKNSAVTKKSDATKSFQETKNIKMVKFDGTIFWISEKAYSDMVVNAKKIFYSPTDQENQSKVTFYDNDGKTLYWTIRNYGTQVEETKVEPKYLPTQSRTKVVTGFEVTKDGELLPIILNPDGTIFEMDMEAYEKTVDENAEEVEYAVFDDGTTKAIFYDKYGTEIYSTYETKNIDEKKGKVFIENNGRLEEYAPYKTEDGTIKINPDVKSLNDYETYEVEEVDDFDDDEAFANQGDWKDIVDEDGEWTRIDGEDWEQYSNDYNDRFIDFEIVDDRTKNPKDYLHPEDFIDGTIM